MKRWWQCRDLMKSCENPWRSRDRHHHQLRPPRAWRDFSKHFSDEYEMRNERSRSLSPSQKKKLVTERGLEKRRGLFFSKWTHLSFKLESERCYYRQTWCRLNVVVGKLFTFLAAQGSLNRWKQMLRNKPQNCQRSEASRKLTIHRFTNATRDTDIETHTYSAVEQQSQTLIHMR